MGFFDKENESGSPIGLLRAHIGTFLYNVKIGKKKFKDKGIIGDIFFDMDQTKFLLDQATRGTMYDFRKRIDEALWDAAVHKYTEDMEHLKKELLKAVDAGVIKSADAKEEEKTEKEEEKQKTSGSWQTDIKEEMKAAEEDEKRRKEILRQQREKENIPHTREMTEEDCRELWKLIKDMDTEFKEMKQIADDWLAVNGKKEGCFGLAVMMLLLPLGTAFGILSIF